jgi:hypothetical protein
MGWGCNAISGGRGEQAVIERPDLGYQSHILRSVCSTIEKGKASLSLFNFFAPWLTQYYLHGQSRNDSLRLQARSPSS